MFLVISVRFNISFVMNIQISRQVINILFIHIIQNKYFSCFKIADKTHDAFKVTRCLKGLTRRHSYLTITRRQNHKRLRIRAKQIKVKSVSFKWQVLSTVVTLHNVRAAGNIECLRQHNVLAIPKGKSSTQSCLQP